MTEKQIEIYEYCKKHKSFIIECIGKLPFASQKYGCGGLRPNIEHTLQEIHTEMHTKVLETMHEARKKVDKLIEEI